MQDKLIGLVAFLIVINKGVSYLREQGLARVFGASHAFDAYATAIAIAGIVFGVVGNTISTVAIPLIKDSEVEGAEAKSRAISTTLWLSLWVIILGALLQAVFAGPLLGLVAPSLPQGAAHQARMLLWLLAPTTAMMGFWIIAGSLLNTEGEFALPIYVPVFLDIILLATVLTLGHTLGIRAAALGFLLGNLLQTVILIRALKNRGLVMARTSLDIGLLTGIMRSASPVAIAVLLSQSLMILDKYYASGMPEGVISCLHYSILITNIPVGIFAVAVGTVLFPSISGLMARGEYGQARREAGRGMILSVGIGILSFIVLWFGAEWVVKLLFGHGRFDAEAVRTTAGILRYQAVSVPTLSAVAVLERVYYSRGWNRRPLVAIGLATAAFILSQTVIARYCPAFPGHMRIGLGYGIYGLVNAIALLPGYNGAFRRR